MRFFKKKFTYEGKFSTIKEAKDNTKNSQSYGNKKYDVRCGKNFFLHDEYTSGRSMIVPILMTALNPSKKTCILDIGGAANPVFLHLNPSQRKNTIFHIIDRHEAIRQIKSNNSQTKKEDIYLYSDITDVRTSNCDIAYFGSSIQYMDDYKSTLHILFQMKPSFIIISESIFTKEDEDFFVIQTNMKESLPFPNRFISLAKFKHFIESQGYKLKLNLKIPGPHTHESLDRNSYDCHTLIFTKNTH